MTAEPGTTDGLKADTGVKSLPVCLTLTGLEVVREKNGARFTLKVPSLCVHQGEILAVVGQSGCGKSTLLDTLAMILRPQQATRFEFHHRSGCDDLLSIPEARRSWLRSRQIGYVLQSGGLFTALSVEDNIALPARLCGVSAREAAHRARALAERLEIADQLEKKPQYLSGGQRQRAAIARALILKPPLILADEPTAAVDHPSALEICELFAAVVRESGTALIIVSHDLELMLRRATTVVSFTLEKNTLEKNRAQQSTVSTLDENALSAAEAAARFGLSLPGGSW